MAITLASAVVVPEQPEKVYNELWLSSLVIAAPDANKPVRVSAKIEKARTVDGQKEFLFNGTSTVVIKDFFSTANASEIQIMTDVLTAIKIRAGL